MNAKFIYFFRAIVTTTLDMKHPEKAGTLGGQLHHFGGNLENRINQVRQGVNKSQFFRKGPAPITVK